MRIYVAGPYTKPNPEKNTERAIFYGDWLKALGFSVYIPHLSHFWDKQIPHEFEFWMEHDFEWLEVCDAVFRFDGESSGADREVAWAKEHGLPVYYTITEIPRPLSK